MKSNSITRLPPVLILHMQRTTMVGDLSDKDDRPVHFPLTKLDLSSILSDTTEGEPSRAQFLSFSLADSKGADLMTTNSCLRPVRHGLPCGQSRVWALYSQRPDCSWDMDGV